MSFSGDDAIQRITMSHVGMLMTVHAMSDIELDRLDTIKQLIDRQQAADIFGLTARHINRLSKAYKNDGVDGRISKRRGKQPACVNCHANGSTKFARNGATKFAG